MKNLVLLHIIKDDIKFFGPISKIFDANTLIKNKYALIVQGKESPFCSIPRTDKIIVLRKRKEIIDFLCNTQYDAIYFHSLPTGLWKWFRYIPKTKKVIWWAWGYDIYHETLGLRALIDIPMYKPQTLNYHKNQQSFSSILKSVVKKLILQPFYYPIRNKVIARVDYFQPVIKEDYVRMFNNTSFRALEFYPPNAFKVSVEDKSGIKSGNNIMMGNSASETNNHLDVWNDISKFIPINQKLIIPLSYGDAKYAEVVKENIKSDEISIEFLDKFLPSQEYFRIVDGCSYYVSGVLRQQAMGNIYHALYVGQKVFFYKDSLVYKNLKDSGFVVFTIEDMNPESLLVPLTTDEINKNKRKMDEERDRRDVVFQNWLHDMAIV